MSAFHFGRIPGRFGDLAIGLALQGLATGATWWVLDLPASYLLLALGLYGVLAFLVVWTLPGRDVVSGPGLGPANRVTFGRALLVLPVVALVPYGGALGPAGHWWIILVSTTSMVLDGVDGRVARRTGTETAFGARFDMELDTFFLLGLSILAWESGKVGPWILLVGGMRYLFVAASWIWPVLGRELPESRRRKTVCVVQGVVLLVCLGPIIPSWMASASGVGALILLVSSFALDVRWLVAAEDDVGGRAGRPVTEG